MTHQIRLCQPRDLPELIHLCAKHAEYERADYSPDGKHDALKEALFHDPARLHCLVVDSGETIVGYASYTFDFSTWDASRFLYLDCLYLEPEWRGRHIGEELLVKLRKIAKQKNCVNIQWQTPAFNDGAIRFYLKQGALLKEKARFTLPLS